MKKLHSQKKGVIMFMPVIGTGGVEKNLFLEEAELTAL